MIKLILLALCVVAVTCKHGYGDYHVNYGFHAGGGYGGHGTVHLSQNPHHYTFGVKEGHGGHYHHQTASTPYGGHHGGYGGGGYGGGYGYGR